MLIRRALGNQENIKNTKLKFFNNSNYYCYLKITVKIIVTATFSLSALSNMLYVLIHHTDKWYITVYLIQICV